MSLIPISQMGTEFEGKEWNKNFLDPTMFNSVSLLSLIDIEKFYSILPSNSVPVCEMCIISTVNQF